MKKIKDALQKQIKALPDFEKIKKHIDMTITAEGLRIELTEDAKGTFFELGSALPSDSGKELLVALAQEVGRLPNQVSIEGHTDSKPYSGGLSGYSNWELSVDRANAARRIMQSSGLQANQVSQVTGICRSTPTLRSEPGRSRQSENLPDRAIPGQRKMPWKRLTNPEATARPEAVPKARVRRRGYQKMRNKRKRRSRRAPPLFRD
jgi:outer membrane protein OmpA-like peptidoglycan-associated protein